MTDPIDSQAITQVVMARFKRRLIWALMTVSFLILLVFTYLMRQGDTGTTGTILLNAVVFWSPVVILHTLYAGIAEWRDHTLRHETERERRWQILEKLSHMSDDQKALTHLMLDEANDPFDNFAPVEKPKRNPVHRNQFHER